MNVEVLDHGYVKLIESWGSDERIVEAARMSTDKGFQGWGPVQCFDCDFCRRGGEERGEARLALYAQCLNRKPGDEKLLKYLYSHKHMTPFEMAGMTVEVQAPIFVFREWHRHRTQSYNELSARYTPLPDVNYVPTVERLMMSGGTNKQAQGVNSFLSEATAQLWVDRLRQTYVGLEDEYQAGLDAGVLKELARLCIPVGRYSRMRASTNLRNWLAFLTLRMDPAAQWEIRQYANVVASMIELTFPSGTVARIGSRRIDAEG